MPQLKYELSLFRDDNGITVDIPCPGPTKCDHAICVIMPPTGEDKCFHEGVGWCHSNDHKVAALRALTREINKHIKEIEEEQEQ